MILQIFYFESCNKQNRFAAPWHQAILVPLDSSGLFNIYHNFKRLTKQPQTKLIECIIETYGISMQHHEDIKFYPDFDVSQQS